MDENNNILKPENHTEDNPKLDLNKNQVGESEDATPVYLAKVENEDVLVMTPAPVEVPVLEKTPEEPKVAIVEESPVQVPVLNLEKEENIPQVLSETKNEDVLVMAPIPVEEAPVETSIVESVSEKPEEVRKTVENTLAEAEKAIAEETKSTKKDKKPKKEKKKGKAGLVFGVLVGLAVIAGGAYMFMGGQLPVKPPVENPPVEEVTPPPVEENTPTDPVCNCSTTTDIHAETCPLYVEPAVDSEPVIDCTCTPVDDVHAEDCPLWVNPCTCETTTDEHDETCVLYVEPVVETVSGVGKVITIGNDTITVEDDKGFTQEYFIDEKAESDIAEISTGSKIEFSYIVEGSDNIIVSVEVAMDVETVPVEDENVEIVEPTPEMEDVFADFKNELEIINQREPKDEGSESSESIIPAGEKIQTMELPMEVPGSGDIWFRFAWKKNDTTTVVPGVNDVIVELKSPSGSMITQENISKYGRFWIEGNILNFAIKNAKAGTWQFLVTKTENQNLGDISANVLPLTGFISVDKAQIDYVGDDLYAIWSIGGVRDPNYSMTIKAKRADGTDVLVYSGNSMDDGIQLIDTIKLSTTKLPAGEYDFVIEVQDWDTKTVNGKQQVTSKSMSHKYTIEGVVIK